MRSLKPGARKKPRRVGSSQPRKDNTHSCSRFPFLSFSLCCGSFFEDRSARNGCCWAWRQRTRASWCHQDVAWCWCWEFARVEWAFRVVLCMCKATIHFGSQWVTGSKAFSMPRVAGLRQNLKWLSSTDRTCSAIYFPHRQWNKEKTEMRKMAKTITITNCFIMTARASLSNFERSPETTTFSKLVKLLVQAAALLRRFGRTGRCGVRFDEV